MAQIPGICWIRILYCYPEEITEELIQTIKKEPKVCHYLDIPIQHASDRILRRMGRRTTQSQLRELIERLREEIPDICLRTTLITGFPGETQEDHEKLVDFVNEMEFDRRGRLPLRCRIRYPRSRKRPGGRTSWNCSRRSLSPRRKIWWDRC